MASHLSVTLHINLVSKQHEWESFWIVWLSIIDEALSPLVNILKTRRVSKVEGQSTAISASVESEAQRLELFLPGSVPNLKRHHLSVDLDLLL